jgi:hypothetical protein
MNPKLEIQIVAIAAASAGLLLALLLKPGERIKSAAFLAGWLLPGAGQVLLGRWRKGLFFFSVLGLTWLAGMWLSGFRGVGWEDNPFYYLGQYGSGAGFIAGKLLSPEKAFPRPDLPPSWFDPGLLYVCVAGLLNLVVALNVFDVATLRATPVPPAAEPPKEPA